MTLSTIFEPLKVLKPYKWVLAMTLCFAVLIAIIAPSGSSSFLYQFAEGKPWQYDLLTAPYDIPIYKSQADLELEKDSIRASIKPIYRLDGDRAKQMLEELQDEYRSRMQDSVPLRYYNYLNARLTELYKCGILEVSTYSELQEKGYRELQLLSGNELRTYPVSEFYSYKDAYASIIDSLPSELERRVLVGMHVERFLHANLSYDKELTNQMESEALSGLALSSGIVQKGERIIDQGEIVNKTIYNILESYKVEYIKRHEGDVWLLQLSRVGLFVLVGMLMLLVSIYLLLLVPSFDRSLRNILLIHISSFLIVAVTAINQGDKFFDTYMIPYVMLPIMWRIFFSSSTSLVAFLPVVLVSALFVEAPLHFIFIQILAGLTALISLQRLHSRGQMIRATFLVYLVYVFSAFSLRLFFKGTLESDDKNVFLVFSINFVFLIFTYIFVFLVERVFGYVSQVSLVELGDINKPLLRELSEVAPGTFQHSMQVSILAAEATAKVGGDVPLVRTGALYHDIGKMKNPAYFTENQGNNNPHDLLSPEKSAHIIIRHVTDGIALAQKHNLPMQIIDFIRTHHGLGLVKYFYITAQNENPDKEIDPALFTYQGANPWTKEQGILMLADATEASSRSLKEYTIESITTHVDRIVDSIVASGLLNGTPLTFRDIQIIKEVFVSKLRTMYHTRISYPDKR